jgi:DNA-binding NarL/FixJ family response regulator
MDPRLLGVVIVAPHDAYRRQLVAALAGASDMVVLAARASITAIGRLSSAHAPRIALVDVDACDLNGESSIHTLLDQFPAAQVVLLGPDADPGLVIRALRAGAEGYLPRDLSAAALVRALRGVQRGEPALPRGLVRLLVQVLRGNRPFDRGFQGRLSPREQEVFAEIVAERSNQEIAERLCVTEATVKTHVSNILRKTQSRSRTQLQLLHPDPLAWARVVA